MKTEETIVNLIFEPGKGSVTLLSKEAVSGQPMGELPTPVRAGYRFEGWYQGGTQVTSDTVVTAQSDLRLTARWTKIKKEARSTSLLRKQKRAILILAAVAATLAVAFVIVAQLIAIYSFEDVYRIDGVQYSDKYIVKRQDGVYKMFDEHGSLMETNGISENVFIARGSGNHYRIDPFTGAWELRAAVDSGDGEHVSATNRLLLYPSIGSSYVYSIKVTHRDGHTYTFQHTPQKVYIEGFKDSIMEYDPDLYSKLCFGCGSTYTDQKLVLANAAKLENGKIDYAVYGLEDPQASFTITGVLFKKDESGRDLYNGTSPVIDYSTVTEDGNSVKVFQPDSEKTYTVHIGDLTPSKNGYYVQLEGREAIYILDAQYLQPTVLQPVESLVVPRAVYPVNVNYHSQAKDFYLRYLDEWQSGEEESGKTVIGFNYIDLDYRNNTVNSNRPYQTYSELMEGYRINDSKAIEALGLLLEMIPNSCKKIGITAEALAEYGLTKDVYYLTYGVNTGVSPADGELYITNELLIGPKTEQGTRFVASLLYDMIVEVDQYYLSFLEWNELDWYDQTFLSYNLSYGKELTFERDGKTYAFSFDNRMSYAYYITSSKNQKGELVYQLNLVNHDMGTVYSEGGKYYYKSGQYVHQIAKIVDFTTVKTITYRDAILHPDWEDVIYTPITYYYTNEEGKNIQCLPDFVNSDIITRDGSLYYVYKKDGVTKEIQVKRQLETPVYRFKKGLEAEITPDASGMYVYNAAGGANTLLDYTITDSYINDSGVSSVRLISARNNFRALQYKLLYFTLGGMVSETEFFKKHGMSVEEYLASGAKADATITLTLEDYAKFFNNSVVKDEDGNEVPLYTENNEQRLVYRFYRYTDWKTMVTIELMERDENGEWASAQEGIVGKFFVKQDMINTLFGDAERVINGEKVESWTE